MTYYRKQRMESFKRAMFADRLNTQSDRDEASRAAVKEEQEPWYFQPSMYAAAGSSGLAS